MKIVAIIAEYNPFHNGHKYHIDSTKKALGADAVIVIMSGNFVQRGEIAIADKYTRAKMALSSGVDLVLELPCVYAVNSAERFANGSVSTLNTLGIIDFLSFGTESDNIDELEKIAQLYANEQEDISKEIKSELDKGVCYPFARSIAYEKIHNINRNITSSPNNILALEYLKALYTTKSNIKPFSLKRYKAEYHSLMPIENIASATALRGIVKKQLDYSNYMPKCAYEVFANAINDGISPVFNEALDNIVLYQLRKISPYDLSKINDVSEGLENRIIKVANETTSIESLIDKVKTKRYTYTRIARIIISSILGITKEISQLPPSYIRVLAMNDVGKNILSLAKENATLPIINKTANYDGFNDKIFNIDILASDLYSLCYPNKEKRIAKMDFKRSPIIL